MKVSKKNTETIHLIGAGLAGSLLATFLARRGYQVEIFERRPDMRKQTVDAGRSINLALANRGIRALESAGVYDEIKKIIIPMRGRMLHDLHGSLTFQAYGKRESEVIYSVSRGALNIALLNAAESTGKVKIHFGQRCNGTDIKLNRFQVQSEINHTVKEISFKTLIGTDGSASALRDSLVKEKLISCREEPLDHGYKELTIPAAANGQFQMEKNALHIWPRGEYMLIALPNLDGSFTATLFLPHKGEQGFNNLTNAREVERFFAAEFPDSIPLLPKLSEQFLTRPTGTLGTVRCSSWTASTPESNILILGDAAHAIVPFHGQGMNCAFEDCESLDRLLERGAPDWKNLFSEFEKDRKTNADAIADLALENYIEMRDTVRDPKFHLKKNLEWTLEERFPNRFVPRYSMIMFHQIPYAIAKTRGEIQEKILNELTEVAVEIKSVDLSKAANLIRDRLPPISDYK